MVPLYLFYIYRINLSYICNLMKNFFYRVSFIAHDDSNKFEMIPFKLQVHNIINLRFSEENGIATIFFRLHFDNSWG